MEKELKLYETPHIEVLEMSVERSFATSPSYGGFDGEEEWD